MTYTDAQIREIVATFRIPARSRYPELDGYHRDELYADFFGGGGMYLAARMARAMRLKPGDVVLDLGCGKGSSSLFLANCYGVRVVALDLWTSATYLDQKFSARGYRDHIVPLNMDVRQRLPFADDYFDAIFSQNSFSFYGGSVQFLQHILKHLKPGGPLVIGSEVLTSEFTPEQLANPPYVYAFPLPNAPQVNVFEDDFKKQHTPEWWRELFAGSGLLDVDECAHLDDADALYEELVRYEYEHNIDPFDVQICLEQMEWAKHHEPRKSLFVIAARKR